MDAMERIASVNPHVVSYLEQIPHEMWARNAFKQDVKADHVTNNMTETWSNSLGPIRGKAIVMMFEEIIRKVMAMIVARKNEARALTCEMLAKVFEKMNKNLPLAKRFERLHSGDSLWEVSKGTKVWVVDLPDMKCNCGEWQINEYPCPHALKYLDLDRGDSALPLLHPKLKTTAYMATYETLIWMIPDSSHWDDVDAQPLLPLLVKKQAGRPKLARRKKRGSPKRSEVRGSFRCSYCQ